MRPLFVGVVGTFAIALAGASCGGTTIARDPVVEDRLAQRFPLAALDDRALCDRLLARSESDFAVAHDPESKLRRKVIVSDLHLGPGASDPRFSGIEDFYSDTEWGEFLAREGAKGPTDLVIAGDFIEFWQIASAMHALPRPDARDSRARDPNDAHARDPNDAHARDPNDAHARDPSDAHARDPSDAHARDRKDAHARDPEDARVRDPNNAHAQSPTDAPVPRGRVLGADQSFAQSAIDLVIAAHPDVFHAIGRFLDGGDHRVIIIPGNHDADLLWPKVQLAIARATNARDPGRLLFLNAVSYVHGGVYIAHGHELDAANRFRTQHAPFGRDDTGRCRLQSNWGEVFVDLFYTETERQVPFIDNLYPENAAILWTVRDNPDLARDLGAAIRAVDLLRAAQKGGLNRDALGAVLQGATGITGEHGPDSPSEVVAHVADRLSRGDHAIEKLVEIAMEMVTNPASRRDLSNIGKLQKILFGDATQNAVDDMFDKYDVDTVVLGHTHTVGGFVKKLRAGYYANTGSWISVASVAELKAKGIAFENLSVADRNMFPSKMTAIVIEYQDGEPMPPVVIGNP